MAFTQLDGAPGEPVQKRRRARICRGRPRRVDRGALAAGRGQSGPHARDLGLDGAGENHPERVEQHELGMLANGRGDGLPRRAGDEMRERLDGFAHRARPGLTSAAA